MLELIAYLSAECCAGQPGARRIIHTCNGTGIPAALVAGMALRGIASSCLDLSDGLASDLVICWRPPVWGLNDPAALPLSAAVAACHRRWAGNWRWPVVMTMSSALLYPRADKPGWRACRPIWRCP